MDFFSFNSIDDIKITLRCDKFDYSYPENENTEAPGNSQLFRYLMWIICKSCCYILNKDGMNFGTFF